MNRAALFVSLLLAFTGAATAEILPQPGRNNPRVQSVRWEPGETVLLTMLPKSALTVLLEPGERIRSANVDDESAWRVTVSSEEDSLQVEPRGSGRRGSLAVSTDRREYRFGLRTDEGLTAAYLVEMQFGELPPTGRTNAPVQPQQGRPLRPVWQLKGDRAVYPAGITDDGSKITIAFGPDQPLPAIFAIGATGEEEVVNGYMRGEVFVIDRMHAKLVFRIDGEQATARRTAAKR